MSFERRSRLKDDLNEGKYEFDTTPRLDGKPNFRINWGGNTGVATLNGKFVDYIFKWDSRLDWFSVNDDLRRCGLASNLFNHVEQHIEDNGLAKELRFSTRNISQAAFLLSRDGYELQSILNKEDKSKPFLSKIFRNKIGRLILLPFLKTSRDFYDFKRSIFRVEVRKLLTD